MAQFFKIVLAALTIFAASVVAIVIIITPTEHDAMTIIFTTFVVGPALGSVIWCLPIWRKNASTSLLWQLVVMLAGYGSLCATLIASGFAFVGHGWLQNLVGAMLLVQSVVYAVLFLRKMVKESLTHVAA